MPFRIWIPPQLAGAVHFLKNYFNLQANISPHIFPHLPILPLPTWNMHNPQPHSGGPRIKKNHEMRPLQITSNERDRIYLFLPSLNKPHCANSTQVSKPVSPPSRGRKEGTLVGRVSLSKQDASALHNLGRPGTEFLKHERSQVCSCDAERETRMQCG